MADFINRHIGLREGELKAMLQTLKCRNLDHLIHQAAPAEIRTSKPLHLSALATEEECLKHIQSLADKNKVFKSYIGQGYYEADTPAVIKRNILENPVWLTPYTPYQPEIAQGRLTALLNFQTMITELTEMDIANASLLDEGTACAEAVSLAAAVRLEQTPAPLVMFMDQNMFIQTKDVVRTRAGALGVQVVEGDARYFDFDKKYFCVLLQTPSSKGQVFDWTKLCQKAAFKNILTIFSADPLSLCLFKTPGCMGADVVVGSCQRFGLPMMFGGPHAAYIAVRKKYAKRLPGRLVGVSQDRHKKPALRLALQTREQHIRRERATSNICTAQALLAAAASMFAVYYGPKGLFNIAKTIHTLALSFAESLEKMNWTVKYKNFFDTVQVKLEDSTLEKIYKNLLKNKMNAWKLKDGLSFSFSQSTTKEDVKNILNVFNSYLPPPAEADKTKLKTPELCPNRTSPCLKHAVFKPYHSETAFVRYVHRLQNQDLTLTHSMIPLGSCTMKLNGTTELLPITWPQWAGLHPFAPLDQTQGYQEMTAKLEQDLCEITGFDCVSFQPNAGSQGELAGLLAIKAYHISRGEKRNICLIPVSAHGTNPASAQMAGLEPAAVLCDSNGHISQTDLTQKITQYKDRLAGVMITYPSTSGVFEHNILSISRQVHKAGGLVYLDGANMNALVGISRPAEWGADICHLNLHKTFCIPHGGGGPGVGPIAAIKALKPFLPGHFKLKNKKGAVSSAPLGSAGILIISYAYMRLMGGSGLTQAAQTAILNANYLARQLKKHFKILYTGETGWSAHEFIIDVRKFRNTAEVTADDIAKRLMDYGFHAPTMSWPVPGTLMIEPTESENKSELDRFCSALIEIRKEIQEIEDKKYSIKNNVLKNAPHVLEDAVKDKWAFPYPKEKAFYPLSWVREHKFWPPVSRIQNAYGDINLFCSCL